MGKYSSVSYNKPQVTPQLPVENPLRDTLPGSMPPGVSDSAGIEAARSNAVADVPDNQQSASSANTGDYVDLSNERSGTMQGPRAYEDTMQPNVNSVDRFGEPLDRNAVMDQVQRERVAEAKRAGVFQNNWNDQESLRQNYKDGSIKANEVGTLYRAGAAIGEELGKLDITKTGINNAPSQTNGMDYLSQGTGRSAVQTSNNMLVATSLLLPVVSGAADVTTEDGQDPLSALLAGDLDMGNVSKINGAMLEKDAANLLGTGFLKISKLNKDVVDAEGRPIDPRTVDRANISGLEAGKIGVNALISAGILARDTVDGQPVVIINPLGGRDLYQASHGMSKEVQGAVLEMSTSTPVSREGMATTAARRTTNVGNKVKINQQDTPEMKESIRVLGNMPLVTSPARSWIGAMLLNQAMLTLNGDVAAVDSVAHANVEQDTDEDPGGRKLKMKVGKATKGMKGHAKNIAAGGVRFSRWWEDYSVHRLYQAANDVNQQRDMMARAVMGGTSKPRKSSDIPIHKLGITQKMGHDYWKRTGDMVRQKNRPSYEHESDLDKELGFLLSAAHALDIGPKAVGRPTASMLPGDILAQFTPEMMASAAVFGRQLKSLIPSSKKEIAEGVFSPETISVAPEHKAILQRLINESDNKTWGFVASAYIDMADYIDSKERGIAFTPQMVTSIDQNSAGRAFLAMDIGNQDLLERVGVLWHSEFEDEVSNTLPHGNPRKYFMQNAQDVGIYNAINSSQGNLREAWKAGLKKYSMDNPKFIDDFGKKVLMTTDYGKPAMFHQAEAAAFLHKYPEFRDDMLNHYADTKELIGALNDIFTHSLYASTDVWQQAVPKDITQVLQMFGRTPEPTGFFGEKVGLGGFIDTPIGEQLQISGSSGTELVELTKRIQSAMAKAKAKGMKDEDGNPIPEPGPGTAAINQVGPVLGQMRESIVIALTLLHFNQGKQAKDILFSVPVFDNMILNANSFPQVMYYANNVAAPAVFGWDIQTNFLDDFKKQFAEGLAEVKKEGSVDIGSGSKYYGTTVVLDKYYGFLKNPKFGDGTLSKKQKEFLDFLESPSSGYKPPEGRNDVNVITSDQMEKLFTRFFTYRFIEGDGKGRVNRLLDWGQEGLKAKQKAMEKLKRLASQGKVSFMT